MKVPGEELLIKLWETIADKGIGSLLRPWQMRRDGKAGIDVKRSELLALAQTEIDVAAIRRGEKVFDATGRLTSVLQLTSAFEAQAKTDPLPHALSHYADTASRNAAADAMQREVRLAKAVVFAEDELARDGGVPNETPVAEDWLYRWRECASGVSSEELQSIWGKVLAGEVKAPGRFSLRTLDFVRNLSHSEAGLIERLSPFVIQDVVYRGSDVALSQAGINFGTLLSLQALGVIAGVDAVGLESSWVSIDKNSFIQTLKSHGRVLVVKAADPMKVLKLPARIVTAIGQQVLQLGTFNASEPYLREVAEAIKAQGFTVEIGTYLVDGENSIRVFGIQTA